MTRRPTPDASDLDALVSRRLSVRAPVAAPPHLLDRAMARVAETPQGHSTPRRVLPWLAAAAVIALAVLVGMQVPALLDRTVGTNPSPTPGATTSPAAPTETASPTDGPMPTEEPTPTDPTPTESAATGLGPDDTLLSFVRQCDVLPPIVGPTTTVLGDGRVIWPQMESVQGPSVLSERTLGDAGIDRLIAEIRDNGLFETDAVYRHERRPGTPEPPGHGLCVYDFIWHADDEPVHVSSTMWLGDEEEETYYEPAPERRALDDLARRLADPESWFDADEWAEAAATPFEPDSYLVLARLFDGAQLATLGAPDIDEVSWPFAEPPHAFGDELPQGMRCGVAPAADAERLAAELAAAGMEQFERPADGPMLTLPWAARDSAVEILLHPQRPDGEPPCEGSEVADE